MPLTLPTVTYDPSKTIITRKTFVTFTPAVGIPQVASVRAAGTVTASGTATVTVTGSGITGSPVAVSVPVLITDTPYAWAAKARTAINANGPVSAVYLASGAGTEITLRRITPAANDATLNIALATGTATGITAAATSFAVTTGSAATATSLIGKVLNYDSKIDTVKREVPDAKGRLRPDRIVPIKQNESFKFETEDVTALTTIFGGINGDFLTGTLRVFIVDPDDAAGSAAVVSNAFPCTAELEGGLKFKAGDVTTATITFTALAKVLLTADASTLP